MASKFNRIRCKKKRKF